MLFLNDYKLTILLTKRSKTSDSGTKSEEEDIKQQKSISKMYNNKINIKKKIKKFVLNY